MNKIDVMKQISADDFWALRGKSIQAYANVEQSVCSLFATLGEMSQFVAATIFFKITSARARNDVLEKLIRVKFKESSPFWNSFKKITSQLDEARNRIVHWHFSIHLDGAGFVPKLVLPNFWDPTSTDTYLLKNDLVEFIDKCLFTFRSCDVFTNYLNKERKGLPDDQAEREQLQTLRYIFRQEVTYPIPETHPLFPILQKLDSPPQSSQE